MRISDWSSDVCSSDLNQVLHEQVVLLTVVTEDVPRVGAQDRLTIELMDQGFCRIFAHYGFMQTPNIPVALRFAEELGVKIDLERTTYYLGRESVIPSDRSEEHTSDLQSLMRNSYAVFCWTKNKI